MDLWGRMRALHREKVADFQVARWDRRAAQMTLTAEVTLRWLELRAARAQLALLQEQGKVVAQTADLLENRFKQGGAQWTDLLAQRQTLRAIEAQRAVMNQKLDTATAELRLLLGSSGVAPEIIKSASLPHLPPLPAPGLPARLVGRRPDVQAAWYELLADAWGATAARANRLPSLNISGAFSLAGATPVDLFQGWIASALAGITGPLLQYFERKYAAQEAAAAADAAQEELKQTLLEAFRDVERALGANRHLSARAGALASQARLAQERAERLSLRFRNGTGDYLELYVAELDRIKAQQTLLSVRADLLAQRVQLARALGGGWSAEEQGAAPARDLREGPSARGM